MKRFYSDYVNHCVRFYARHPNLSDFRSAVDKANWKACEEAFKNFTNEERSILLKVYRKSDTLPDNVFEIAIKERVKQDVIWDLISQLEKKVAKRRGLI